MMMFVLQGLLYLLSCWISRANEAEPIGPVVTRSTLTVDDLPFGRQLNRSESNFPWVLRTGVSVVQAMFAIHNSWSDLAWDLKKVTGTPPGITSSQGFVKEEDSAAEIMQGSFYIILAGL